MKAAIHRTHHQAQQRGCTLTSALRPQLRRAAGLRHDPQLRQRAAAAAAAGTPAAAQQAAARAGHSAAAPAPRAISPAPALLDASGCVVREAALALVPPAWAQLLQQVAGAYAKACSGSDGGAVQLVGVYLRGSLPRGLFLRDVSDVDTLALVLGQQQQSARQLQHLHEAVRVALEPALAHQQAALGFTKVELKVLQVPPGTAAAARLAQLLSTSCGSPAASASARGATKQPRPAALRASHCADVPCAFELKTQAVTLAGVDLPELLPAAAALPPPFPNLPSLADDVAAARRAAEQAAAAGDTQPQVAAARWCLKRLLRAAFELVQPQAGCWTRDLWWAAQLAGQHLPELQRQLDWSAPSQQRQQQRQQQQWPWQQQLDAALQLYVQLQPGAAQPELLAECWALADSLLPRLETLFLKLMLTEEPGGLTHHVGAALPNPSARGGGRASTGGGAARSQPAAAAAGSRLAALLPQALGVLHGALRQLAPAGAGRAVPSEPPQLLGSLAPPAVQAPVWGAVRSYDCADAQQWAAAAATVWEGLQQAPSSALSADVAAAAGHPCLQDELLGCQPQPVVLRGVARDSPCMHWGLATLEHWRAGTARVRVSRSLQFPFVQPALLELLINLRGSAAAPSLEVDMTPAEFVHRLQPGCPLPRAAFEPHEHYYMQAALPPHLEQQLRVPELLAAIAAAAGSAAAQQLQLSQAPRLWASPAGAVSPCHFDDSASFLLQLRGSKRMLFWSPDQLHRLYPYPDAHLLRRRSRVNLASPDAERFPLFAAGAGCLEAVLQPGDAVFFPARWPHHTESLGEAGGGGGVSLSVTFRCSAPV